MADGTFPTLVSKDRSSNAAANPMYVQLSDGSAVLGITGGALDVNVSNATIAVTQSGTWNIATVTTLTGITNDVNIADGGNTITVDGTVLLGANSGVDIGDVDVTSVIPGVGATNLGKAEDAVHATGDVGVMGLAVRNDAGTPLAADGDYIPLMVNASGALYVTGTFAAADVKVDDSAFAVGTDSVGVVGFLADETTPDSVDEGDVGAARMTLDRKQLMVLVDATTDSQRLAIDSSGHAQVDLAAVSVTAVPVSKDGSANSEANPIWVQPVSGGVSGTEVHDYKTATPGADASDNHDYTVTGTTFLLKSVIFAGSGGVKAEIQTGPVASLATVAVGFIARQGGVEQLDFNPPVEVPVTSTGTVRVIVTNRQGAAMDVYSTIIGNDVA